jgi:hypothetical protein
MFVFELEVECGVKYTSIVCYMNFEYTIVVISRYVGIKCARASLYREVWRAHIREFWMSHTLEN